MTHTSFGYQHLHLAVDGPAAAPPVLLLHGWGSNAALMRPIADALRDAYRVYTLDLPGHGASPPPPEPWGVPEHAALVHDLLTTEIGQPATLIGHSNGGRISLYMASDPTMAAMINKLVLISPSGVIPLRSATYYLRKYTASALKAPFSLLPRPLREAGLDWLRHSVVWRALGSSDYNTLTGVMRATFVKTVTFHLEDRLPAIQAPTLLFWGDQDTAISRHQMDVLESRIPDAGLVVLPGAGHYGYLDAPDLFLAATRHFLAHA